MNGQETPGDNHCHAQLQRKFSGINMVSKEKIWAHKTKSPIGTHLEFTCTVWGKNIKAVIC